MKHYVRCTASMLLCIFAFSFNSANAQFTVEPPVIIAPPVEPEECFDCDGKIDYIKFRFTGSFGFVEVESRRGRQLQNLFYGFVQNGQEFEVFGTNNFLDKKSTLGATIYIRINGGERLPLHTSCSEPIGPGTVVGDLLVVRATSRNGGLTCPTGIVPPGDGGPG